MFTTRTTRMMLATFALAGFATAAVHADSVDQSQLVNNTYMAGFSQTDLAQSFQQANDNITGASVVLQAGLEAGAGDVTITLYDALPNNGGSILASGTAFGVLDGQTATVSFTQTSLTPDQTYFLVFTDTNSQQGLAGATTNPYSRGQVYANSGYGAFPSYDYTFQTFSNPNGSSPLVTPEPAQTASMALGLLGLGGLAFKARKRKASVAL